MNRGVHEYFTFLSWSGGKHVLAAVVVAVSVCAWVAAQVDPTELTVSPRTAVISEASSPSVLRTDVDLVLVNVVLDRAGRRVTGLQKSDFSVVDNNTPRAVRKRKAGPSSRRSVSWFANTQRFQLRPTWR